MTGASPAREPAVSLPGWLAEEPAIVAALERIATVIPEPTPEIRAGMGRMLASFATCLELAVEERHASA